MSRVAAMQQQAAAAAATRDGARISTCLGGTEGLQNRRTGRASLLPAAAAATAVAALVALLVGASKPSDAQSFAAAPGAAATARRLAPLSAPALRGLPRPSSVAARGALGPWATGDAFIAAAEGSEAPAPSPAASSPAAAAATGVRVGLLMVSGQGLGFREEVLRLNVTNETYFQTEVPDAWQMPLAAKFLAMSQTVDVVVAAHGELKEALRPEFLRACQTVALTTNVPIVPYDLEDDASRVADIAVQMGEIRQQAILGGGPRKSSFFGIGKGNSTDAAPKKQKVYF